MEGFEPTTCCLQNSCSNQLSYIGMVPGEGFEPPKAQGRQIYSLMRLTTSLSRHKILQITDLSLANLGYIINASLDSCKILYAIGCSFK